MKLYMRPAACSLSPHIVCRELGLPVELVEVDRATGSVPGGGRFLDVNPNGYVPVLELDDGSRLTEGPAIVQYLAELRPEAGLAPPAGTLARTRIQSLLNFVSSELHKPMGLLFQPDLAPAHAVLREQVGRRLDWIQGEVVGPLLAGDGFTLVDAYLFACLNWAPWIGIDLGPRPRLLAFMRHLGERQAVREALAAEDLMPHGPQGLFHAPGWALRAGRA